MEMPPPDWLNKEYIEKLIKCDTKNTIKVLDIGIDFPVAAGDNFICDIYQVNASYLSDDKSLKKSFIIKVPRENKGVMQALIESGACKREARVYHDYLPKVNELLNVHNVQHITAKSYNSGIEDIVILEDLKTNEYKMVDRIKQLDYAHTKLVLTSLATYHAASYVIHEREPKLVEDSGKDLFFRLARKDGNYVKFVTTTTKIFIEEIKNIPELVKYSKRLEEYVKKPWEIFTNALETKPHEFTVLNHGDLWMTNVMFKYNTKDEPQSVMLLDLQGSNYTTFALDLLYFLYTSVRFDIFESSRDELLNIYFDELNRKLKLFGSKRVLTREEFYDQIHDHEVVLLFVYINMLPWFIADGTVNVTIDDSLGEIRDNPIHQLYRSKLYQKIIVKRIIEFADKGLF